MADSSSNTSSSCSSTTSSSTEALTMPPERCLPFLDIMDLGRLLLTSHRLREAARAFIRALQADVTRGQSSLHSPLPCLPPSPPLGVPPLPFLPPGFEWIDALALPLGKQNRRLLRVKRRREEAEDGEEEEEEEEEEDEEEGGCRCGNRRRDSNDDDIDQVKEGGLAPSCCQDASCPCFRRAHKLTSSSSNKTSNNDTTNPSSKLGSSSSSSSVSSTTTTTSLSIFDFECSSRCHCLSDKCRLRPTQTLPPRVLQLRYTPGKGWGVFFSPLSALPPFLPAHTFVAEYVGELIGTEEARRRLALYDKESSCPPSLSPSLPPPAAVGGKGEREEEEGGGKGEQQQGQQQQHNYLLTLLEEGPSFLLRTSIDATQKGNVSRFFNHSCAPNLTVVCVRNGGILPRLCLFTSREVKEGEELTFAYGEGGREGGRGCRCGARKCKGFLPFHPGL